MTRLLASVASAAEARIALNGGADIIDIKNPAAGVLGAVDLHILREIVQCVGGRRPVSATIGDIPLDGKLVGRAIARTRAAGADIVKVGFFEPCVEAACLKALAAEAAKGARIVAVFFADRHPELALLPMLSAIGLTGVMLDTANKHNGSLRQLLPDREIAEFIAHAQALGLLAGAAGSLQQEDIPPLLQFEPDYLGFRGALCASRRRTDRLDEKALRSVRACIPGANTLARSGPLHSRAEETWQSLAS